MNFWLKITGALVAVWLVAAVVIHFARGAKPTPASVTAFLQPGTVSGKSAAERTKIINKGAAMLNRLTFEERSSLRRTHTPDTFFRALEPDEQKRFLDAALPSGFKQMMEAFNKMDPAKRKEFVQKSLAEMKERAGDEPERDINDPNVQQIINEGLRSFYSDTSAEVKLDLAPLIDQMQKNLETFHR